MLPDVAKFRSVSPTSVALSGLTTTISQDKTPTTQELLHHVGVMLALYVLWATSPPLVDITEVTIQEPPSLFPEDHRSRKTAEEARGWDEAIGQGWKIGIEADLLTVLATIPKLAEELLDGASVSETLPDPECVTPSMELREVLQIMLASEPDPTSPNAAPRSSSAFHLLPPTSSGVLFPLAPALNKTAIADTSVANAKLYAARGLLPAAASPETPSTLPQKRKRPGTDGDALAKT
jgi:hypothetical protein